jgi:hypothetical protein
MHLLKENIDKIYWPGLSRNPSAIHLLEQNKDKIDWNLLSSNPEIFELDLEFLQRRMDIIREELIEKAWHPLRFEKWCI